MTVRAGDLLEEVTLQAVLTVYPKLLSQTMVF